ncbi:protein argonaute-2-like [Camellia sinensis]|uniref:protein argonaute-2-like n=1 Tax=Camellia sinensis TaxID=4442 RepID=UPI0010366C79|nr:protein argonaute-2-like [Camellia sinensis]
MTVTQYAAKFEELARYGTRYVANDEEKARMFEWGLDLTIRGRVLPQRLPSYAEVLEMTLESEREVNNARKAWNERKGSQASIGPQRIQKGSVTAKPYSRPQPQQQRQQLQQQIQRGGYQQRPVGQIQCFHCQQLGHKKSECPQLPPSGYQGGGSRANAQAL